ncbi:MAG: M23 family metallopeptidase [Pseudomonadota bacterium]
MSSKTPTALPHSTSHSTAASAPARRTRSKAELMLGNESALSAAGTRRKPDRRQLSLRWLSGVLLTGVCSLGLMGGALAVAFNGQQQLASLPAEFVRQLGAIADGRQNGAEPRVQQQLEGKGDRIRAAAASETVGQGTDDKRVLSVATAVRQGDIDVIKTREFIHISAPMAVGPVADIEYPPFNPLAVFSGDAADQGLANAAGRIYGAEVESEVIIQVTGFPTGPEALADAYRMSVAEAEQTVRENADILVDDTIQLAAFATIDNGRFDLAPAQGLGLAPVNMTVLDDNISVLDRFQLPAGNWFDETVFTVDGPTNLQDALLAAGFSAPEAAALRPEMAKELKADEISTQHRLVLSVERTPRGELVRPMRVSAYASNQHVVSYARRDDGIFVRTPRRFRPLLAVADRDAPARRPARLPEVMPTIYDSIYRATMGRELPEDVGKRLVSILASDVDFQTRVRPTDRLDLFYTADEETGDLQILHAKVLLGDVERRYYRFVTPDDGKVDYYDETGKSAKKFLIRNPVPTGKFRSGFGPRRHPVLRHTRMHWGVDWSAPRGTPIIAAGNGTVKKAGWAGGYGKQTLIQHANGYVSSYSHQTAFAKGVTPGARVRQGQVIGYIGSTGLSTGPHLHYEVIVNGNKVNPLKIRLPQGRVLKDDMLDRFMAERDRIDSLVSGDTEATTVASR